MSIPPLVCSTPPPPDQCEDDKENEDFDLTYNLSQEDDDDEDSTEYNYGNYSGYNIYPPKTEQIEKENWSSTFDELTEMKAKDEKSEEISSVDLIPDEHLFNENVSKFEENVLEDLNLQVNSINVHSNDISTKEYETEPNIYSNEISDKNSMIQDQGGTDIIENVVETTHTSGFTKDFDSSISNVINKLDIENDEILKNTEVSTEDISEITLDNKISSTKTEEVIVSDRNVLKNVSELNENVGKSPSDDEFGDFEDFQCTISSNTQVLAVNSENPWDNNISESPEFGDFRANFNDTKSNEILNNITNSEKASATVYGDDDFGDFDDFKSSTSNAEIKADIKDPEVTLKSNVSVLNLHSPENELQIVDSINNVLTSIFPEEICEPVNDLEGKLELFLSETWGHLIDIDVRQPYIINWNNSLGQKTLLKALCIDSRNILFGPKWNYSTPKYATNLSIAPLQPQKQQQHAQPNTSSTESTEKVFNKEVSTWSDPFTPDGQEYTYAEALLLDLEHLMATLDQMAHKHSTLKISELLSHASTTEKESDKTETITRPKDLDVFGSDTSTKLNKIYSNTINVQPMRHINLPDTHIFTPTDSETPRSKTIHYDSTLPALVPKPVSETVINQQEEKVFESSNKSENQYWEFQDFKGTVTGVSTNNIHQTIDEPKQVNPLPDNTETKTFASYQTQILQPIKIEPIMPTLNWPDPGEVKETFDDFSEFVSSSSWNNEKDNINCETGVQIVNPKPNDHKADLISRTGNMEDEFETFQSAPVLNSTVDIDSNFISPPQSTITDTFTKTINENSDNIISLKKDAKLVAGSSTLSKENKGTSLSNISSLQNVVFPKSSTSNPINPHINSNILLPTNLNPAVLTTVRNQHNTGQILQPLSLESYSQINWPNPGIDLQDLSKFNPINSLNSLKSDTNTSNSKVGSPIHNSVNTVHNDVSDDDIWGEFVSNVPKIQQTSPKKNLTVTDDDEWTDFVSSPSIKPQNGLNTISLNVHTNSSMHKVANQNKFASGSNQIQLDIPALNYITPKSNNRGIYMEKHFQNL